MSTDLERFDKAICRELKVGKAWWLRSAGPSTVELRHTDQVEPIAVAVNEGQQWLVKLPGEHVFIGDSMVARRRLWETAAAVPTPPATPPRQARPRVPFDYYNREQD